MRSGFAKYYGRFFAHLWKEGIAWVRDNIVFGILMLITPPAIAYSLHLGNQDWRTIRIGLYLYVVVFICYLAAHWIRTPWKLDEERQREIANKEAEIASFEARTRPRLAPPEITVREAPTNRANEQRIYVQMILRSLRDTPVINCRGFLQRIWRRSNSGWQQTQVDEPLDLVWSNHDNAQPRTIQPGTAPRLNLL